MIDAVQGLTGGVPGSGAVLRSLFQLFGGGAAS